MIWEDKGERLYVLRPLPVEPRWLWQGERCLLLVILVAMGISLVSFADFYRYGLTLLNVDAPAHLMLAKRVVGGLTPGLAHLGGYWLPLPHILVLPFVWSDFMYWSGLAGSIISMAAFVLTAVFIYKATLLYTEDKGSGLVAAFVFAVNPNVLYLQSTPMTELPLMLFIVASVYYLSKWGRDVGNLRSLVAAAAVVFLATLTRYEGWALLLAEIAVVLYICIRRRFSYRKTEGHLVYFGTLAGFGVLLWLVWEQMVMGDFLFFHRGEYSNLSFTVGSEIAGNPYLSLLSYGKSTLMNVGILGLLLGLAGLGYFLVGNRLKADKIGVLALLFPIPFFVYSLYGGQVEQKVPGVGAGGMYCVRYGLLMVPALAIFAGYLAKKSWAKVLVAVVGLVGALMMVWTGNIITLNESVASRTSLRGLEAANAAAWLRENYDGGLVLMESKEHESTIFWSRIPMDKFIYEGDLGYWAPSLVRPTRHARWILMSAWGDTPDKVWNALYGTPELLDNYDLVYQERDTDIYKRRSDGGEPGSVLVSRR